MTEIIDIDNNEFANLYLKTWIDIMSNEGTCKTWNNNTNWTETHLTILYKLAVELGYCNKDKEKAKKDDYGKTVQQEYYQVDFSLYKHYEDSYWNLDYAIEHENDVYNIYKEGDKKDRTINKGWFDEFAKLLPLKCRRSRVIIGYDYFYNKEIEEDSKYTKKGAYTFEDKLAKCSKLLSDDRVKQTVSQSPILLIIFPSGWKMKQIVGDELIEKPLIKIVNFPVVDGILKKEGVDITNEVLDDKMKVQLKEIYKNIKGGNVELELSRI